MKLYRFSPISDIESLLEAIKHIHTESYKLCFSSFGKALENAGNIGVFCHYDDEYEILKKIQKELVHPSDNPDQKYFELKYPITIEESKNIPAATYSHLYIRKPDPYRHHVGDLDFYLPQEIYQEKKKNLLNGEVIPQARIFERPDLDMIELYHPDSDVLAYVSTKVMAEKVHLKLSEHTNL